PAPIFTLSLHDALPISYVIPGARSSGVIGINGAAAHLVAPGDLVILIAYGTMDDAESRHFRPRVVFVDAGNRIVHQGTDAAMGADRKSTRLNSSHDQIS